MSTPAANLNSMHDPRTLRVWEELTNVVHALDRIDKIIGPTSGAMGQMVHPRPTEGIRTAMGDWIVGITSALAMAEKVRTAVDEL